MSFKELLLKNFITYYFYKKIKIFKNSSKNEHLGEFGEDIFIRRKSILALGRFGEKTLKSIVPLYMNTKNKIIYSFVGEDEADTLKNKISFNSPIGKGLMGRKVGDEVTISVPKGELNFKIIKIF